MDIKEFRKNRANIRENEKGTGIVPFVILQYNYKSREKYCGYKGGFNMMNEREENVAVSINSGLLTWIISISAWKSVVKPRNIFINIILECMYCIIVSVLPICLVSCFVIALFRGQGTEIEDVIKYISWLVNGTLFYLIISNYKQTRRIEDYVLSGGLYIDECLTHIKSIKFKRIRIFFECAIFMLLFGGIWCGTVLVLLTLNVLLYQAIMIGCAVAVLCAYGLFVYGTCDDGTRKKRKTVLSILISLGWMIAACIRINQYCRERTQDGVADIIILSFSVIFTIPTMRDWFKGIPKQLRESYGAKVCERKAKIIKCYDFKKEEVEKVGRQFKKDWRTFWRDIALKWKSGEKKKILKAAFFMVAALGVMILALYLSEFLNICIAKASLQAKFWVSNLSGDVQVVLSKIFVSSFFVGMICLLLFKSPSIYKTKMTRIEKVKCIIEMFFVEVTFGAVLGSIWVLL